MGKQLQIKGTERKCVQAITDQAEVYETARNLRQQQTIIEVRERAALEALMVKHDLVVHIDDERKVEMSAKEIKAKVSKVKSQEEGETKVSSILSSKPLEVLQDLAKEKGVKGWEKLDKAALLEKLG